MKPRLLVVSPVRNEVAHIDRVARAMAAQELEPARWIVIDDSSTDGTNESLRRLEREIPFMEVCDAPSHVPHSDARDRLARAAAPRNFNNGLRRAEWRDYTHIMKLDGDIELKPGYLRTVMERFSEDATLGIAGGVLVEPASNGGLRSIAIPRQHVHGALKCYSRECFSAIGGVREQLGWDTIDETYARMRGFTTVSFDDLVSVHHRAWGSADGALRGRARLGECAYITHYPPLWVLLRSVKLACSRPFGLVGGAYLFGYIRAVIRRRERVQDPAYKRFTRRELRGRLVAAARGKATHQIVAAQPSPSR